MARFEVRPLRDGGGLVLEVQADLLGQLNTRVVVPLMPRDTAPVPARQLNPVLQVGEVPLVMVTQFLSAVRLSDLGEPVGSLADRSEAITAALDLLLTGV